MSSEKKSKKEKEIKENEKSEKDKKEEKEKESQEVEKESSITKASGTYGITVKELEDLMGAYKERGSEFRDLKLIESLGGVDSILKKLKTDSKYGYITDENRLNDFGSNKVFVEPVPPFCAYVWEALEDLMVRILIAAAIVQIVLGATLSEDPSKDWIDGLSIVVAVLVVTLVGSITNWKKEHKFHELNNIQNEGTTYKVIRNGNPFDIPSDDLVVGDLIQIMVGDIMPADLLLVDGNGIKMDESSLTGESETLKKDIYDKCMDYLKHKKKEKPPSPLLLSGTNLVEGTGSAIVIAVGDHSQKGIIRRTVDNAQENNKTPLEEKLEDIAEKIGYFGMFAGIVTLIALIIRFIISFITNTDEYHRMTAEQGLLSAYVQNNHHELNNGQIMSSVNAELTNPKKDITSDLLDIIMLCVSIIVVAIPEGLPLAVTLSLAFSIKKLMDQQNLVRKMHACETMGGANFICTDKTGTLTKNEMNIFKILTAKNEIVLKETMDVEHSENLHKKNDASNKKMREDHQTYFPNEKYWEILKTSIALNTDGTIKILNKPNINGDLEECETKNKTDNAFIDFLYRFKSPISAERKIYQKDKRFYKQIPFDSKRKRMTTFIANDKLPTKYRLFTKGGAENVKNICKYYVDPDTGEKKQIGDQQLNLIKDTIENFNKQMLRSLYICYKDMTKDEFKNAETYKNSKGLSLDQYDLVFVAVVGIRDSLRNGVKEAVLKCQKARVTVIMVTGDNIITATAIAKDCHILGEDVNLENMTPQDIEEDTDLTNDPNKRDAHLEIVLKNKPKAITGNTFYQAVGGLICRVCGEDTNSCKCPKTLAEAEQIAKETGQPQKEVKSDTIKEKEKFIELTENLRVMARSQPIHKYALVLGLKELDKIVAVTGDGTNDAPALSKSDVGFAMFAGTDIAKEASDIIIMDNNFSSLVIAIIYGRNIYDNIRKFLQFQLSVNFCACLLVFICACIGNESPLRTIQMLWINLIMDSLGSLALATEPPYDALLDREPTKKDESIINGKMWKHIGGQSLFQLFLLLFLYLYAPHFIRETDYVRLAENYIINYCYGKLPGNIKNLDNIIYGTGTYWGTKDKLKHGMNEIQCGMYADRQDLSVAFTAYTNVNGNSAHMSIVFNVFVIYTLFNQINCRVLDDSLNIFIRINNNFFFPLITFLELFLQVILIECGKEAFKVTERGLSYQQWLICIGFSACTFILCVILKFIPIDKKIQEFLDNNAKGSKVGNIDDLEANASGSKDKLVEKNNINLSVIANKKDEVAQENNDKKLEKQESKISRSNKRKASIGGTMRNKKKDVNFTNNNN